MFVGATLFFEIGGDTELGPGSSVDITLLDEYLLQYKFYLVVIWNSRQSTPNLKLLLVGFNRTSLEVVEFARFINRTLFGSTLLLTLRRMNHRVYQTTGLRKLN